MKELLKTIIGIIRGLPNLDKGYDWLRGWKGPDILFDRLERIYYRNIYLNRIDLSGIELTDRMINDTRKSRNRLYRAAAELFSL